MKNGWDSIEGKFPAGTKVRGKVSSIMPYGLFVNISQGVDGLVHISEVSKTERIDDLSGMYSVGDDIDVMVVSVDPQRRRISLSIKRLDD